jgi:Fe-S oxidoreductase
MTSADLKYIKKIEKQLYRCIRCGYCRDQVRYRDNMTNVCPFKEYAPYFESFTANGKIKIAKALLDGSLPLNDEVAKRLIDIYFMYCTTCRNCWEKCYVKDHIEHVQLYEAVRAELFSRGYMTPQHKKITEWLVGNHNPYLEKHEDRTKWQPTNLSLPEKADIVYYVGCTASYRQHNVANATVNILKKGGINFTTLGLDEWCCGSPTLRIGARDLAEKLAKHNVEAIKKRGAKQVITSCAGCFRTMKLDYPEMVGELGFEVIHTTQFLHKLLKEGKFPLKIENKLKVTYHDPCHMSRHFAHIRKAPVHDEPRELLKSIPGIELVEMPRTKLNAFCCGAGGGVRSANPDISLELAAERVREAEATGASALVSSCPFCYRNLSDAAKNINSQLKIYDVTELLERAM